MQEAVEDPRLLIFHEYSRVHRPIRELSYARLTPFDAFLLLAFDFRAFIRLISLWCLVALTLIAATAASVIFLGLKSETAVLNFLF